MGRVILADESVQKYLQKLVTDGHWNVGLIIGQQGQGEGANRDFVIHVVRTPEPVEDVADVETDLEAAELDVFTEKKPHKSVPRPESLEDANELWVSTHAKQVTKMLPGGMSVIGIFAVASPKMMEASQNKLRQLLYAVHRSITKGKILQTKGQTMMDRILLQICAHSRKITCRTLDVNYHLSAYRAAEWKYQVILDRFIRLETKLAVNLSLSLPSDTAKQNLSKQIKTSITPYCDNVWESLATVNKQMRNLEQTLEFSDSKKGRLTKGSGAHHRYVIDLYLSATGEKGITSGPVLSECGARMHIQGAIAGRAFVHHKATVREGIEAIKQDVIRSLSSRSQLLCEDINVIEEDRETNLHELYDTPKRVFAHVPGMPITFCDYVFKDETNKDIMERYSELLDIRLQEENLELEVEAFLDDEERDNMLKAAEPTPFEGPQPDQLLETADQTNAELTKSLSETIPNLRLIGVMASGAMAAIVAGMSYLYLGQES